MIKFCQFSGLIILTVFSVLVYSLVNELRGRRVKQIPKSLNKGHVTFIILFLFVFGVLTRVLSIFTVQFTDEGYYIHEAWRLYLKYTLYNQIHLVHPPASPLITSYVFKLFGVGLLQAKAVPVLLSTLSIPLVFLTSKHFWGVKPAFFSTILFSLSPAVILHTTSMQMYSELIFFSLLSAYLFLTGLEESNQRRVFFSGLSVGVAVLFRLFGLFLFGIEILFLVLGKKPKKFFLVYSTGFLLTVLPVFYHYHTQAPDSFLYLLLGYHLIKISAGVGLFDKLVTWLMTFLYYPILAIYIFAFFSQRITKTPKYVNDSADLFFALWALGVLIVPFLPVHKEFLSNVYTAYFIPPVALLAGNLVETLNTRYMRTLFICFVLTQPLIYLAAFEEGISFSSDLKNISRFITENTEQSDTLTGSYITASIVSFLSRRELTEDVIGLTSVDSLSSLESQCKNLSYCEENAKKIIQNSRYVIMTPGDNPLSKINGVLLKEEGCFPVKELGNVTVYSCR